LFLVTYIDFVFSLVLSLEADRRGFKRGYTRNQYLMVKLFKLSGKI